jgi:hypothetical protein
MAPNGGRTAISSIRPPLGSETGRSERRCAPNLMEKIMHMHSEPNRSSSRSLAGRLCCAGFALTILAPLALAGGADAQSQTFFQLGKDAKLHPATAETCAGTVKRVLDATNEAVLFTSAQYGTSPGGGQGGQFDPNPVLTVPNIKLVKGECINAHVSALVGGQQSYGVSSETMFQVALVPAGGTAPIAMEGHYATPYGINSPAVATAAEPDVDMFAANFYQGLDGDVQPGTYNLNVYWAGAPGPGGAIGAAFVAKVYIY